MVLGTPQYMSPEQASGRNSAIDARTDQFALGTIMYEMLSGRPAYFGETLAEVIFKVVYEKPRALAELVPSLPSPVVAAVEKAMEKDPAARFPDVGCFVGELGGRTSPASEQDASRTPSLGATQLGWSAHAGGMVPSASGGTTAESPRRETRGLRVGILAGAIALAGAGVFVAVRSVRSPDKPLPGSGPSDNVSTSAEVQRAKAVETLPPPASTSPLSTGSLSAPAAPSTRPTNPEPTGPKPTPRADSPSGPRPPPKDQGEELSPELARNLEEAERALAQGNSRGAKVLARKVLNYRMSPRAFALLVRIACKEHDLQGARVALFKVGKRERKHLSRTCQEEYGFSIE
ncbi:MAG: hypothetical protein HY698_05105 [Deltaproteobacteria bacterium]|nr:hypothetical protein [Deltaproteobacteria bacterium]